MVNTLGCREHLAEGVQLVLFSEMMLFSGSEVSSLRAHRSILATRLPAQLLDGIAATPVSCD